MHTHFNLYYLCLYSNRSGLKWKKSQGTYTLPVTHSCLPNRSTYFNITITSHKLVLHVYIALLTGIKKKKVKQSRYTPWRRLGGEGYSSYSFLTSALDGGEWSASRPGRTFTPGERNPRTHWTGGWVYILILLVSFPIVFKVFCTYFVIMIIIPFHLWQKCSFSQIPENTTWKNAINIQVDYFLLN
jgi:hypothetical protein